MSRSEDPTLYIRPDLSTVVIPSSRTFVGVPPAPVAGWPEGTDTPAPAVVAPPVALTVRAPPSGLWESAVSRPTQMLAAAEAPHPGCRIAQYDVLELLGEGGMGRVFLGRDVRLHRPVAIKFLHSRQRELTERFLIEARATALCQHENIVVIYDVGEHGGAPYMVLEYLSGKPLTSQIENNARISYPRTVEIICSTLRALRCAHSRGIVHRDLKPDNIFITDSGTVKVLDFGIAKILEYRSQWPGGPQVREPAHGSLEDAPDCDSRLTQVGTIMGTVDFMSPEQWCRLDEIDHLSDIWAIGILIHLLICGRHPLAPRTGNQLVATAMLDVPMPSMQLAAPPEVPRELIRIVDRCLFKPRDARWQSAEELLTALQPFLPSRLTQDLQLYNNPYQGLSSFQERDQGRMFGREREIKAIVPRVRDQPITVIVGDPGVGKSSFVRAGVIPAVKASVETWDALIIRPGGKPLEALASVVAPLSVRAMGATASTSTSTDGAQQLVETLRSTPGHLVTVLRRYAHDTNRRLLVVVDQIEELYTQVHDPTERDAFTNCLAMFAEQPDGRLRVILLVRSDYFEHLCHGILAGRLATSRYYLGPPNREDLRDAIVEPAKQAGFEFEWPETIDRILDLVAPRVRGHAPRPCVGALPLLQLAMGALWDRRSVSRRLFGDLTVDELAATLAGHAEQFVAGIGPYRRDLLRTLLVRLVTRERTCASVEISELQSLGRQAGDPQLIEDLIDARLLAVETLDAVSTSGLVHEALLSWPVLSRWLDEEPTGCDEAPGVDPGDGERASAPGEVAPPTCSARSGSLACSWPRWLRIVKLLLDAMVRPFRPRYLVSGGAVIAPHETAAPILTVTIEAANNLVKLRPEWSASEALAAGCNLRMQCNEVPDNPAVHLRIAIEGAPLYEAQRPGERTGIELMSVRPPVLSRQLVAPRRLLHLSDLHFETRDQATIWCSQLVADLDQIGASQLDAIVVSGDIANRATGAEYDIAQRFLHRMMSRFSLAPRQMVLVPGNHDVSWAHSKAAYRLHRREDVRDRLVSGQFVAHGDLVELREDTTYRNRLQPFAQLYRAIKGVEYPLAYEDQGTIDDLPDLGLSILGLSSVWEIDHHFHDRASIHPEALAKALLRLRPSAATHLRIAVFHHPIQSPETSRIRDAAFLEQLAVHGFRLALHGHVHKAGSIEHRHGYGEAGRRLEIIAAGTFGAPTREWVPGYPLQYQLLVIGPDQVTVETRCRREVNGAWMPDAQWLRGPGQDPQPRYTIEL